MQKWIVPMLLVASISASQAGTISKKLQERLSKAAPDDHIKVLVWMSEQADMSTLKGADYATKAEYLRDLAERTQRPLLSTLASKGREVLDVRSFWLVNMIYMEATPEVIREVAQRSDVAFVDISRVRHIIEPHPSTKPVPHTKTVEWNIDKIKADSVWAEYGLSGDGVIVGTMDTGIDPSHPALQGNFSGHFFDAVNGQTSPYDDHGHGTHVAGTIAGGDGPGPFDHDIGIAYNAQIVSAKAFDSGGSGSDPDIIACFQYFVTLKADSGVDIKVVSNSWGSTDNTDTTFLPYVRAWHEFDIIPVFANGNSGPSSGSAGTPGNFPNVIGVGATTSSDDIASFSSRGPAPNQYPWSDTTLWSRPDWNFIKPDISAPGQGVTSSVPGGGYATWDGTSMATPHITGVIALMFEKNPGLDYGLVYDILTNYAVDHPSQGAPYPNNDYGWGRVNALLAVENTPSLDSPYLRVLSPLVDDASGNNNGIPDPGETVTMYVPLRNIGLNVFNVTATITSDDPDITITDNTANYGDVYSDSTAQGDGFEFTSNPERRPGLPTTFVISISGTDSAGAPYTKVDTFNLQIGVPEYYPWFADDFENGLGQWITGGTSDWEITEESSHSASHSATDSPNAQYGNNEHKYLMIAEPIDLSDAYFARIHLWQKYSLENGWDYGYIQVSTDSSDAGEWTNIATVNGDQDDWQESYYEISGFAGQQVYIRFLLETDGSVTRDGWYIDDVSVELDVPLEGVVISLRGVDVLDDGGNGIMDPGESGYLFVHIFNMGNDTGTNVNALLSSADDYITINDSTANNALILPGQELIDTFQITAAENTPREHVAVFNLHIAGDNFTSDKDFALIIGQKTVADPSGPDGYGYYAFEDTDTSYNDHPTFEWVEIAPSAGGPGTHLNLGDDYNHVLTIPFTFNYYGTTYSNLTICSNGWIAMGSVSDVDFSNSGIPNSDGPPAMIAPLWDDLNPNDGGEVAYYIDNDNHRVIVEWKDIPHYGSSSDRENFEVILYDPAYYPTVTGDGEILFQYLTDPSQDDFTTGIEDPTETIGLQFYFDGSLDRLATPITAGKAIKFTTGSTSGVQEPVPQPINRLAFGISPNVITGRAVITLALPSRQYVDIRVYDLSGRVVSTVFRGQKKAGIYRFNWNPTELPNGVYFVSLTAGKTQFTRKALIIR